MNLIFFLILKLKKMNPKNSRNLFIHLGPPKTGTTSFQNLLQELEVEEWSYGGISQPRSGKKELSQLIFNYCSGKDDDLKFVCNEIDSQFKKKKNIFISEEMFLVHQKKSSLTDKLSRLNVIAANYNTTYIYVSRSVESVLPSYYQERYANLPEEYQKKFEKFCYSEYCKAYNLSFIKKQLGSVSPFINIQFEDFIDKHKNLFDLMKISLFKGISLNGNVLNKSKVSNNFRILTKKSPVKKVILRLIEMKPEFFPSLGIAKHLHKFHSIYTKKERRELKVPAEILERFKENS